MGKTLMQQNPQWNGKPFKGLASREVMQNLLEKTFFSASKIQS